jgi:hypothetical protein
MTLVESTCSRTSIRTSSNIKIGPRFRKDVGDIKGLAKSIEDIGSLLQPVWMTESNELVFGVRRAVSMCNSLGLN